ncbi:endonuclease domain-containing protein [Candidatus Bipolaricaulota bacterium]|nr:endonuclease domain-containing protein [Candidatus Bipolaricaulota bacterium]
MADERQELAKELRKNQTNAEKLLWSKLRDEQLEGVKFRRQQPIGDYIVDFVTFDLDLVIEVDGGQHLDDEIDEQRDKWLEGEGFTVIRFWNNQVLNDTRAVLREIRSEIVKRK